MKKLAFALGLFAAASVNAAEERVFDWSSQDLASDSGVVATYDRMRTFATTYCEDHLRGTKGLPARASCRKAVIEEIILKVDNHRLTAYAQSGRLAATLAAR